MPPFHVLNIPKACFRPPLPNTIQSFGEEIGSFLTDSITHVSLDNCTDPHYNMKIELGTEDTSINSFLFKNFLSAKFILEGEIKDNVSINIENFGRSFGNILGHVEIRGVLRCFNDSNEDGRKPRLKITFRLINKILISNLFVKDPNNVCMMEIDSEDSEEFSVSWSKFSEVESKINSERCVLNEEQVDCEELFKPQPKTKSHTIVALMVGIAVLAVVAVGVIIVKIPL